ncbi:hypothetical protein [Streptomyces sp. NPDC048720]
MPLIAGAHQADRDLVLPARRSSCQVSGAQPVQTFTQALEQAWTDRSAP